MTANVVLIGVALRITLVYRYVNNEMFNNRKLYNQSSLFHAIHTCSLNYDQNFLVTKKKRFTLLFFVAFLNFQLHLETLELRNKF